MQCSAQMQMEFRNLPTLVGPTYSTCLPNLRLKAYIYLTPSTVALHCLVRICAMLLEYNIAGLKKKKSVPNGILRQKKEKDRRGLRGVRKRKRPQDTDTYLQT